MKTSEFTQILEKSPGKALFFEYQAGQYVRPDFHITEIKNVNFDTVDCGGIRNQWSEVHVQLWENEIPEPNHAVDTAKALKIFEVVNRVRETYPASEIKFEYGNSKFPTAILPIHQIKDTGNALIVQLVPDQTTCKAKDRATTPEEKAAACCAPVTEEPKIRISLASLQTANSCEPGSGCC
ncbi:hypothetical protein C943_03665 [Mariniradius saccharolyticus AK6]|uniref:Uncharacterized protein n=1 Tax=Mariniradius saccharolyticus AK6 TaxID=1239962 RepID=M7YB87_9BACT|nr:DUF6428 family protein [Mariniradius saccharolyticus]EMS34446.1 hypothetical protein C943_03665 [Mariniradius saccharolyticus AK6]